VLFDLGCGDGRVLLSAVRQCGIRRGVGLELNASLAAMAQQNVASFKQLQVLQADALSCDLSSASVITVYLSERGNRQLRPALTDWLRAERAEADSERRIASFCFPMPGWTPAKRAAVSGIPVYLFTRHSLTGT
jgi:hypothetical protein